jgi:hypothetical protein
MWEQVSSHDRPGTDISFVHWHHEMVIQIGTRRKFWRDTFVQSTWPPKICTENCTWVFFADTGFLYALSLHQSNWPPEIWAQTGLWKRFEGSGFQRQYHLFRPQTLETMAFHTDGADCYELGCIYGKLWIDMPSKGISLLSVHFLMYEPWMKWIFRKLWRIWLSEDIFKVMWTQIWFVLWKATEA